MLHKLPLDLSTFAKLRSLNYVYIDKTEYMYNMITGGHRFFLARPRRFGKSLLVSTLKEILTGNRALFNGLWIEKSDYTWQEHGMITLDLSAWGIDSAQKLKSGLLNALTEVIDAYKLDIKTNETEPESLLRRIVKALYQRFGHVAILIDEYDSPILRSLKNPDSAQIIRDGLCQFFTAIKGLDAEVDFVFITGVSSFTKAGLFSGINNLQILTLNEKYSGICGYTDKEVDHYFTAHIDAWAQKDHISHTDLRQQIKMWYNGYHFDYNVPSVYNPFSLMNALHAQSFENFWFQSGTPTFLVDILKKEYRSFDPEKLETSKDSLGIFEVGATPLITLMFQTGYLTIVDYNKESRLYKLDYPNLEVKVAFQKYLLEVFTRLDHIKVQNLAQDFRIALNNENIEEAVTLIKQLFTNIPYQLHSKEEKFYHALLLMVCITAGIKVQSEYSISHGRIDLVLDFPKIIYVVEVKFNKTAEEALEQIEERKYYEPLMAIRKPITLLGLSFKREPNNFDITYVVKPHINL